MYTYILPEHENQPVSFNTSSNSLIIIGANGAGKSRLGAWIEKNSIEDRKVMAQYENNGELCEYKGREMSDGERVALYLIAQSLCVPKNRTIVVDEPEVHLHRSIMNRLWTAIEKERRLLVYI